MQKIQINYAWNPALSHWPEMHMQIKTSIYSLIFLICILNPNNPFKVLEPGVIKTARKRAFSEGCKCTFCNPFYCPFTVCNIALTNGPQFIIVFFKQSKTRWNNTFYDKQHVKNKLFTKPYFAQTVLFIIFLANSSQGILSTQNGDCETKKIQQNW